MIDYYKQIARKILCDLPLAVLLSLLSSPLLAQAPNSEADWDEAQAVPAFQSYLFFESSFGAFWANTPSVRLKTDTGFADRQDLPTDMGLASKRSLGLMADNSKRAFSLALFYASSEEEFTNSRYRIDGLGLEAGYQRNIGGKFGLATSLGLAAARTALKIDGAAFDPRWSPALTLSAGGYYALSPWRSIGLDYSAEILPTTRHGWRDHANPLNGASLSSRIHTQVNLNLRRRF